MEPENIPDDKLHDVLLDEANRSFSIRKRRPAVRQSVPFIVYAADLLSVVVQTISARDKQGF